MKRKGFTLVELLGVIVVLAIIALIAVPTILGVIDKTKKGALQDSGYGLIEAATLYYAQYQNGKTVRFDIEDNKIITEEENKLIYKGNIKDGTVLINNKGKVTICINDGKRAAYKNYQDTKVTVVDHKTCAIPENNSIVYLDGESTINSVSNEELLAKIEELEGKLEEQNAKIETLEAEKSNQTDVTSSINNLTNTHNSDISMIHSSVAAINSRLGSTSIANIGDGTITNAISTLNDRLTLSKREKITKEVNVPNSTDSTTIYTFTAPKDGLYLFNGSFVFDANGVGIRSISIGANNRYTQYHQVTPNTSSYNTYYPISATYYLLKNETVTFKTAQMSGSTLKVTFYLSVESCN